MTEQPIRPPEDEAAQAASSDSEVSVVAPSSVLVDGAEQGASAASPAEQAPDADAQAEASPAPKKRIAPQAVITRLIEAWPQAFFSDPRSVKPLAIGTLQHILANRPDALDGLNSQAIRTGIKFYTSRLSYHYGMVNNTHRITLSGENADEVDDKARDYAKAQIVAIQAQRAARRAAQAIQSGEVGGLGPDDNEDGDPGARSPRHKRPVKKRSEQAAEGGAAGERSSRPARSRNERSRPKADRVNRRAVRADERHSTPSTESSAVEPNLTMEEKLARLAAHFGKTPS